MSDPIWSSMANAMKIVEEADALLGVYDRSILSHDFGRYHVDIEDWTEDTLDDESNWCTFYNITSYRVLERMPRLASRGMLSFAISFYRFEDETGENWEGARRAKFYVGFAPVARAWTPDTMVVNGNGVAPTSSQVSQQRWGIRGKEQQVASWFFVVALDALGGQDDFRREVLEPVRILLNGGNDSEAFKHCTAVLSNG